MLILFDRIIEESRFVSTFQPTIFDNRFCMFCTNLSNLNDVKRKPFLGVRNSVCTNLSVVNTYFGKCLCQIIFYKFMIQWWYYLQWWFLLMMFKIETIFIWMNFIFISSWFLNKSSIHSQRTVSNTSTSLFHGA